MRAPCCQQHGSILLAATFPCFQPQQYLCFGASFLSSRCLTGFPVALPSDSHLQNQNLCTGTGRASTAQNRTWPTILTYRPAVAAGRWELDSAAGCNLGQQIQLLSPPENNKQLLLLTVWWHRRHDGSVTAASESLLNCTGLSSAESCQ